MADFFADAGAWIEQAGKDFVQVFEGDKAVESDKVVEVNKKINGGSGIDSLYGGTGGDIFVLSKGYDIITDFARSEGYTIYTMVMNGSGDYTGQIGVIEVGIVTILRFESGDTTVIRDATGSDVYNSIIVANDGQLVAQNFEVLA